VDVIKLGSVVVMATLAAGSAFAQDSSCAPLYAAARKALDQPGVQRTVTIGDPAKPTMTMDVRKTSDGWYQKIGAAPWRPMPISPETADRQFLENPSSFGKCVAGSTEAINGEAARVWNYVASMGPTPTSSKMWISVSRGLPLKVQTGRSLQLSTYQATP
jgi:hypothetical protein